MNDKKRKAMFANNVRTKAKVGFHNGLNYTNQYGDNLNHVGKFFVDKDGRIINLNRNYDNNGHDITRRNYDSTMGVAKRIRGFDANRRIPKEYSMTPRHASGKIQLRYQSHRSDTT